MRRGAPLVTFEEVPDCRVASQRVLYAFGRLMGRVAVAAGVEALDPGSETFVPDVGHAARALFAFFRQELGERGARDVAAILQDAEACRMVLKKFNTVPSLLSARGVGDVGGGVRQGGGIAHDLGGVGVRDASRERAGAGADGGRARYGDVEAVRVATWNIAGDLVSAQAPKTYNALDQRARIMTRFCGGATDMDATSLPCRSAREVLVTRNCWRPLTWPAWQKRLPTGDGCMCT